MISRRPWLRHHRFKLRQAWIHLPTTTSRASELPQSHNSKEERQLLNNSDCPESKTSKATASQTVVENSSVQTQTSLESLDIATRKESHSNLPGSKVTNDRRHLSSDCPESEEESS